MTISKQVDHNIQIQNAIQFLARKLNDLDIKWILGASGALMVWDIDIQPNDLDVYVSRNDIKNVEDRFRQFIKHPLSTEGGHQEFLMNICGIDVEVADMDFSANDVVKIDVNGDQIPVLLLEKELEQYQLRKDPKGRIPLIRKRLLELGKAENHKKVE